jgi:hypothetical protein
LEFDPAGGVSFPIEPVVPGSFDVLVLPAGRGFIDPEDGDFDIDESGDPGVDPTPATPPDPDEPDPPVVACAHAPALTVSAIMLATKNAFIIVFPSVKEMLLARMRTGGSKCCSLSSSIIYSRTETVGRVLAAIIFLTHVQAFGELH